MDEDAARHALTDDDRALIRAAAESDEYRDRPVPPELLAELRDDLLSFANVPPMCRSNLFAIYPAGGDVEELLQADWAAARELGALCLYDERTGKVNFPLRMAGPNGRAVNVTIAPSTQEGARKPWYLSYVPILSRVMGATEAMARAAGDGAQPAAPAAAPDAPSPAARRAVPPLLAEALEAAASRDDYRESPLPPDLRDELAGWGDAFADHVRVLSRWAEAIDELAGEPVDAPALLARDFAFCLERGLMRCYEGKVLFPVSLLRPDGATAVEVALKRDARADGPGAPPWLLWGVDGEVRRTVSPGRALERWAYLGPWPALLETLADLALPESWDFEEEGAAHGRHAILRSYLTYTFYRLQTEGKVLEDRERGIAAFNTGLVNRTYEPIFACFSPQDGPQPWRFEAFCKQGSRQWGKRLVATFNPLPARARYVADKDDLLYDTDRPLVLDRDHILLDNISRLPVGFLEEELRDCPEALDLVEKVKQTDEAEELAELYAALRDVVEDDSRLERRLINRLQDAVDLAEKRVEWNFRTAVPAFYPSRDSMSLLLPLDLTEDNRPDIALVAELTESGVYLGQTILTMRMAYNNARLICRPDSDWLNTSVRLAADDGDAEGWEDAETA